LRFDLERSNSQKSLSFSFGPHACLGLHLARLESDVALRQILKRLNDIRLIDHTPPAGFAFRRPATLQIAWTP